MNILLLGSGGREHALAWKISQSPECKALYIAPGNAGTGNAGKNVNIKADDFEAIKKFVLDNNINLVVVGPEDPLAKGIVDFFEKDDAVNNIPVLGPSAEAAQLESSKDYAKEFMMRHKIPTASYKTFTANDQQEAKKYISSHKMPVVLKADGLAAGKGVVICQNAEEAFAFFEEVWTNRKFGEAGSKVVVEEFLTGIEMSVFVLTDGKTYIELPSAKDYKRIGEGDTGPNTGGMGAVSPVPFADEAFMRKVTESVIKPTVEGIKTENLNYKGFIFFGLINVEGDPYVIEYNVRMGDPETEVVMPRIKADILPHLLDAAKGKLSVKSIEMNPEYAVTVIAVSGGYPEAYEKGKLISGLDQHSESIVFHAGTASREDKIITSGGRVLAVTSLDKDLNKALEKSYKTLSGIAFEGMYFRKDIGKDLLKYL